MPLSPICQVRINAGSWVATTGGVDVPAAATVDVRLASTTDVTDWYLEITGTDETSTPPVLASVNPLTHKVLTPGTIVSFTMPGGSGKAFLFASTVDGIGGPLATTFALYILTPQLRRVGAAGESREGNQNFGWITKVNPLIRYPGITFAGDLSGSDVSQTVLKINGTTVPVSLIGDINKVLTVTAAGVSSWQPAPTGFTAGGDLSGSPTSQTVIKINGTTVPVTVLVDVGKVLTVSAAGVATWQTPGSGFTAGGDLTGSPTSQTVVKINGTTVPTTSIADVGKFLGVTAANVATWQTISSFTAGGDLGGSSTVQDVLKIHGTSVPVTILADVGKVLTVTAVGVAVWSPVSVTLDGDVTGPSGTNVVATIKGVPTPTLGSEFDGGLFQALPVAVFVNPITSAWDGTLLWVGDISDANLSTFDTTTYDVVKYPFVVPSAFPGEGLFQVVVDATYVYAITQFGSTTTRLLIFDKVTKAIVGWGEIDNFPQDIILDGAGNIFIASPNDGFIYKFVTATTVGVYPVVDTPSQSLAMGAYNLAWDGTNLYATTFTTQIFQIDPVTLTETGASPYNGVYATELFGPIHFDFGYLWATDLNDGSVNRITAAMAFAGTVYLSPVPVSIQTIKSDATYVWIVSQGPAPTNFYTINPAGPFQQTSNGNPDFTDTFTSITFDGTSMWASLQTSTALHLPSTFRSGFVGLDSNITEIKRFIGPLELTYAGPPPPTSPAGTAGGDLTGSYPNPGVGKLAGVPVPVGPFGFGDIGKLLSLTGSPFSPVYSLVSAVTTVNYPEIQISGIAGLQQTTSLTYEEKGALVFWAAKVTVIGYYVTVEFNAIIEAAVGGETCSVELFCETTATSISTLTTGANVATWVQSGNIAGSLPPGGNQYSINLKRIGGSPADPVTCKAAWLTVTQHFGPPP